MIGKLSHKIVFVNLWLRIILFIFMVELQLWQHVDSRFLSILIVSHGLFVMRGYFFVVRFGLDREFGVLEFIDVEETENIFVLFTLVLLNFLILFDIIMSLINHFHGLLMSESNLQEINLNKHEEPKQDPANNSS